MLVSAVEENLQLFYPNEQLLLSPEYLWLIMDGVVKSSTINEKGKNVTLSYWGAKDVLGKPLFGKRLCILECVTYVRAEKIYIQDWQKLSPAVLRYGQQLKELSNIIRTAKAPQRLLLLLDWLANKFSNRFNRHKSINFNITHQELSEIIGVSRITVTKILNQFEQEGIISRPQRNKIIVH